MLKDYYVITFGHTFVCIFRQPYHLRGQYKKLYENQGLMHMHVRKNVGQAKAYGELAYTYETDSPIVEALYG